MRNVYLRYLVLGVLLTCCMVLAVAADHGLDVGTSGRYGPNASAGVVAH